MNWEKTTEGAIPIYRAAFPASDFSPLPHIGSGQSEPKEDIKKIAHAIAQGWEKMAECLVPEDGAVSKPAWNCFFCQIWHAQGLLRIVPGHTKKDVPPAALVEIRFGHIEEAAKSPGLNPDPYFQEESRLRSPIERALKDSFRDPATKSAMRKIVKATTIRIFRQVEDRKDRLMELEGFKLYL